MEKEIIPMQVDEERQINDEPVSGTPKAVQEMFCRKWCKLVLAPFEARDKINKLVKWFEDQPEAYWFIPGENFPPPIGQCDGVILSATIGIQIGFEDFTKKPKFTRKRIEIDLAKL
jgi:hypothetical protein